MKKGRPIWWACGAGHIGCERLDITDQQRLVLAVVKVHRQKHLSCEGDVLRIGGSKQGLIHNRGCITIQLKQQSKMSIEEQQKAGLVPTPKPTVYKRMRRRLTSFLHWSPATDVTEA